MRFLMTMNGGGPQGDAELYAEMGTFIEELTAAGVLLATGGLDTFGTHVSAKAGQVTLTDGPYADTKETIASFALVEVETRDELVALTERFWRMVEDGSGDIRQVYGPGE